MLGTFFCVRTSLGVKFVLDFRKRERERERMMMMMMIMMTMSTKKIC